MAEKILKKNWVSNFTLIGKPIINDYTFKINAKSGKSNWVYNSMNIGIDCGKDYGTVYAEMMGGYSEDNENRIYVHGKKDDGSDDFDNKMIIKWEDRFNDSVLEEIGDMCFLTVGLEKTTNDKTYYEKFLSEYDAIAYIKEYLTSDMTVNVRGTLKYSVYNGVVQVRKNITSIALSKAKDDSEYKAVFTQSVLIDKDSASLKNIDKDRGVMFVDTKVIDYVKEINGVEVKGQYPFDKQFEFAMDFSNQVNCKKIMDKLFKVKSGYYTQINFEGDFIEGGAVVNATLDDLSDDIRDLIDMGLFTEEEALAKCAASGSRERRMVLKKPVLKPVGDDKVLVKQVFEEAYAEEDLILDCLSEASAPWNGEEETSSDDLDWLNSL